MQNVNKKCNDPMIRTTPYDTTEGVSVVLLYQLRKRLGATCSRCRGPMRLIVAVSSRQCTSSLLSIFRYEDDDRILCVGLLTEW